MNDKKYVTQIKCNNSGECYDVRDKETAEKLDNHIKNGGAKLYKRYITFSCDGTDGTYDLDILAYSYSNTPIPKDTPLLDNINLLKTIYKHCPINVIYSGSSGGNNIQVHGGLIVDIQEYNGYVEILDKMHNHKVIGVNLEDISEVV
ncbi:MAG: hypothetical protein J6R88_01505 [Clostridia bacterium]|nr:hypothetical protein [Clostridia bacterium]